MGMPMSMDIVMQVREMVRAAAGAEICAAIDAGQAVDPCAGMTSEERARWTMGDGWVE